jgi:hypothetical protein
LRRLEFFETCARDQREVARNERQDAWREKRNKAGKECGNRKWKTRHAPLLYPPEFFYVTDQAANRSDGSKRSKLHVALNFSPLTLILQASGREKRRWAHSTQKRIPKPSCAER